MQQAARPQMSADQWEALASQWTKHLGKFKTARTARDAMQQGNHLQMLKRASPYGTWRDRVNMLGMDTRTAGKMMSLARRFADAPDGLFEAAGKVSKLFELLPLAPEQVGALCNGDAIHSLTLESISTMTAVKLRSAVRDALAAEGRGVSPPRPAPVRLTVEEEHMLRRYRKCNAEGRAALLQLAGLLEQKQTP